MDDLDLIREGVIKILEFLGDIREATKKSSSLNGRTIKRGEGQRAGPLR